SHGEASAEELADLAAPRLDALLAQGVTTVEVKSGYGLSLEHELAQLEAVALLGERRPARLVATCLAAHIVPDEHKERRGDYVRLVTDVILPAVAARGLASAADVFCDEGAFTLAEAREILEAAARLGLRTRVHGEQLTATGVATLAAELGAASVDHLEHVDAAGIAAMARAGTVAVLLPGATTFLADPALPPVKALRAAGVPMAVATDANPGSSPTTHLWLMAQLACVSYGLMPHEALRAVTVVGARALGLADAGVGRIVVGGAADLVATDAPGWRHLLYGLGDNPARRVWIGGREL
ncbi:MAG: imidazolonepropionase, partial [Myxococcales bacterium]|nr:imidazolonepropionase [Myxococcales bacterium]